MGLFGKKEKTEETRLPSLPDLPPLPEVNEIRDKKKSVSQLPKFPRGDLGEKFSQNTIKEAVTGEKEKNEVFADEFDSEDEVQMMHEPLVKEIPRQFPYFENKKATIPESNFREFQKKPERVERTGPIYVRIDKFEDSRDSLEKIKKQILDIERLLGNIKSVKEEESKELESWEKEIQSAKAQIEKIDRELFSKI